ncbi:MAG TPA: RraA family protein [Gemmataceae bacterium]|jgi:regulator of RNase E activity RraA|nr:RraA family protein [Gemmataceae bacterium]
MPDLFTAYSRHLDLLYSSVIADVLDKFGRRHSALPHEVRPLRPTWRLFGRARTLALVVSQTMPEKPYAIELECIDGLQPGDVLVAATQADRSSALWGELLSTAARAHGAVGVVTDGLTRDAGRILEMDFPVFAGGVCPLDSKGRLEAVSHGEPIRMGACQIREGDWVFGDIDGVVIVPAELAEDAFPRALEKVIGENKVREELAQGRSVQEVFAEYGIL